MQKEEYASLGHLLEWKNADGYGKCMNKIEIRTARWNRVSKMLESTCNGLIVHKTLIIKLECGSFLTPLRTRVCSVVRQRDMR